jgi:hypothetical protein
LKITVKKAVAARMKALRVKACEEGLKMTEEKQKLREANNSLQQLKDNRNHLKKVQEDTRA